MAVRGQQTGGGDDWENSVTERNIPGRGVSPYKTVHSGPMTSLSKKHIRALRTSLPDSDHWLLNTVRVPVPRTSVVVPVNAPAVLAAIAGLAIALTMVFNSDGLGRVPVALLVLVAVAAMGRSVFREILEDVLPQSPALSRVKQVMKSAEMGNSAVNEIVSATYYHESHLTEFALHSVPGTYTLTFRDKNRRAAMVMQAMERLPFTQQVQAPAAPTPEGVTRAAGPATELAGSETGSTTKDSEPSDAATQDAKQLADWRENVETLTTRAAERAGQPHDMVVASLSASLVSSVENSADRSRFDDSGWREHVTMRADVVNAFRVYNELAPGALHTTLDSGHTPTEELIQVLEIIGRQAVQVAKEHQAGDADQLSYLRRLNDARYRSSSLNLDSSERQPPSSGDSGRGG